MNSIETRLKELLHRSFHPVPSELNELDWKSALSDKSDRLAQHLSAFANTAQNGFLVFGINASGVPEDVTKSEGDEIIHRLGNIARHSMAQPLALEHYWTELNEKAVLGVYIPEGTEKPVYPRSGTVYDAFKRSAGQTVKMSRSEIKQTGSLFLLLIFINRNAYFFSTNIVSSAVGSGKRTDNYAGSKGK